MLHSNINTEVPEGEEWRIDFLRELTELRMNNFYLEDNQFTKSELAEIVEYICPTWTISQLLGLAKNNQP